ncbi:RNA polymerase subunit sigma-70 [Actinomadura sp. 1N219]|uniref:RNA polymerase subunit sigma-70 n=1 Tax=Actinomadura sp. 1N219 TaxID=3375152 RepID=UPI0037B2743E
MAEWLTGETFEQFVGRHRRELHVHCYRMLGSLEDAEDAVQETFLRAWRGRDGFAGRSSVRVWLYRIATNACLDALERRPRRVLPRDLSGASDPERVPPAPSDHAWLGPYPDRLLDVEAPDADPGSVVVAKETIELAFMAAIQHLPPRQRAVLIMRDVLGRPAAETADLLGMSVAAVKSALQRARPTLQEHLPRRREEWSGMPGTSNLVRRYMDAIDRQDRAAMAELLSQDVRVQFPPRGLWYAGRDAFLAGSAKHARAGDLRTLATAANRQPAVALYLRAPGDTLFRPMAVEVLRIEGGLISEIVDYDRPELFPLFALPPTLE